MKKDNWHHIIMTQMFNVLFVLIFTAYARKWVIESLIYCNIPYPVLFANIAVLIGAALGLLTLSKRPKE